MNPPTSPDPHASPASSVAETTSPSTRDQLVVYLRNHDAALAAGAERLGLTARSHLYASARHVLGDLMDEVQADRASLGRLMAALGIPPSRAQRVTTLLAERLGRLKPNGSWSRRTPLTDVVELEALSLAAVGTLRLWQTLLAWQQLEGLGPLTSRPDDLDLSALVASARRRVETLERLHDESVRSLVHGRVDLGGHEGG
ncbi:hypothetical protein [Intrasporangium sp. YIM S08009]|uniref:hypothetical protein n=1 Tax=Intrasporangium zincisolvens TaxID=3080018 RepID=UPI002B05F72E|nr:hypothetical protein [Intrasporangium sp. YIM S08009]